MKTISQLAEDIYQNEFEGVENAPALLAINSWLAANIGRLNVMINTSFCDCAELDDQAAAIYYCIYMAEYFNKESQRALRGISTSLGVLSIKEGDSAITFTNKNEVAKTFRGYAADYTSSLNQMIGKYNMFKAVPRQVHGNDSEYPYRNPDGPYGEVREL